MPQTTSKPKLPLTIIILVHRVDERLEKALASATFADQILIVDQGNKTNTTQLEKQFSLDKIILPEQPADNFDFAELRNQSLEYAQHEWIFFLDSDEVITPKSYSAIKKVIENSALNAAYVKRTAIFYGQELKWGEVRNEWLLRMGRKHALRYLRPVHEVVKNSGSETKTKVTLLHYSHTSINEFITKVLFYAKIDAYHRFQFHQSFQLWELVTFPIGKFIDNYFLKLGMLDGWRGLVYAVVMSMHSFFVRVYQYQLEQTR
jgi:glycosyltransferase involved in cell wall biosynthesis